MSDATANFRLPQAEADILAQAARSAGRTQTDLFREWVRSLDRENFLHGDIVFAAPKTPQSINADMELIERAIKDCGLRPASAGEADPKTPPMFYSCSIPYLKATTANGYTEITGASGPFHLGRYDCTRETRLARISQILLTYGLELRKTRMFTNSYVLSSLALPNGFMATSTNAASMSLTSDPDTKD